jgi:tetraacyldisaccharide 4'-kinase
MKSVREQRLLSWIMSPLAFVYAAGSRLKNAAYDFRLFKPRRLTWPVVSVGNLSVGGTGKTPMVLLLANLLEARGWSVDVLSRGYGRQNSTVARVDPGAAVDSLAKEFGDEPLLMARHGFSVYVGADRREAGLLAEKDVAAGTASAKPRHLHILDDGFQHRRLARAVDIVLLQRANLDDHTLPAGRLREPVYALRRADICVLRAEDADLKNQVLRLMHKSDPARIWIVERRTTLPEPSLSRSGSKVLAFCAIGDPRGFFRGLREAGINVEKEIAFRDHHVYTEKDIDRLKAVAETSGVQAFITTEKDSMRLANGLRARLEKLAPLIVTGLEVVLRDEARSIKALESLLSASV